jgi:hypothetical protein
MAKAFYCKYCGAKSSSVIGLTNGSCPRHPNGPNRNKHVLYEGSDKKQYTCKYCGAKSFHIASLTSGNCARHPKGPNKGKHEPAL